MQCALWNKEFAKGASRKFFFSLPVQQAKFLNWSQPQKKITLKNRTLVLHWSRYSMKYAQFRTSFAHTAVQHTGIACGKGLSKRPIIGLKTGKSPMTKLSHAWSKSMGRNDTISHTTTTYYYVLGNKNIGKMP